MPSYPLRVARKRSVAHNAVEVTFEIPQNLQNEYQFSPGQYVDIDINIDGEMVRRSYSICSSETIKGSLSIGVKKIENGTMSGYVHDSLKEGDEVEVHTPNGLFKLATTGKSIFVAGGSGITPILSMVEHLLQNTDEKVVLIYSNKDEENTMFKAELDALNEKYPPFMLAYRFTQKGDDRINKEMAKSFINEVGMDAHVYACGPNGIITSVEEGMQELGMSQEYFHREYFTAKDEADMESASVGASDDEPLTKGEKATVEIKYEGQKFTFECGEGDTILDAALDNGAEPPYSCLVAACCTCRAMVKSGNVEMKDRDALSDKDIEQGFVLTCQSMPRSKNIVLDYDV